MPDRKPPATDREAVEAAVRYCYSAWSAHYYDDYYQGAGAYPPVHTNIVRGLLCAAGARTVLDAGCGPASMLRDVAEPGLERWGFDLTPEMVVEACRVLAEQGLPAERVWEGSVLDAAAFQARAGAPPEGFDAVVCFGVLPHVPAGADAQVLTNVRAAVRPGGLVAIEARNQLFALFTFNFPLRQAAQERGLTDVEMLFYHYHALLPMLEGEAPELFRRTSLAMENPRDWRGHFMASAFVLVGRRPPQRLS